MKINKIFYLLIGFLLLLDALSSKAETVSNVNLDSIRLSRFKNPPKALNNAINVLEKATANKNEKKIAEVHKTLAIILQYMERHTQALKHYYLAFDYAIKQDENLIKEWNIVQIGNIHFANKMYDVAEEYYERALADFKELGWLTAQATAINNLALVAIEKKKYDRAMTFFKKSLELRKRDGKVPFSILHSYNYIGDLYLTMGDTAKAMKYFQYIIDDNEFTRYGNLNGNVHQYRGKIYILTGDKEAALKEFKRAVTGFINKPNVKLLAETYLTMAAVAPSSSLVKREFLEKADSISKKNELYQIAIKTLLQLAKYYEANQNYDKALYYHEMHDSIYQFTSERELKHALENTESALELSKTQVKLVESNIELEKNRDIKNLLILLGLLALAFSFYIYGSLTRKRKAEWIIQQQKTRLLNQKLNIQELKRKEAENRLNMQKREALVHASIIQQKNNALTSIKKELEYSCNLLQDEKDKKKFSTVISALNTNLKHNQMQSEFDKHFVDVYPAFYDKIAALYPNLTTKDLKLLAYHKMNMNTKEIAAITSKSVRAVETHRYRLRKKLDVSSNTGLNVFLHKLNLDTTENKRK